LVVTVDATGGQTRRERIPVQIRPIRANNSEWGNWINELAVIKRPLPGLPRLSGQRMRRILFFWNRAHVGVATTKGGMSSSASKRIKLMCYDPRFPQWRLQKWTILICRPASSRISVCLRCFESRTCMYLSGRPWEVRLASHNVRDLAQGETYTRH
jgi:hypothetical protein